MLNFQRYDHVNYEPIVNVDLNKQWQLHNHLAEYQLNLNYLH